MAEPPQEMAISELHDAVERLLLRCAPSERVQAVLDAGAGHGAFTYRLSRRGYQVSACDLHPELFELSGVEFRGADLAREIPWPNDSFDMVVSLEVVEHLDAIGGFFAEVSRVLLDDGVFVFSTPNIISLKSRIRFLMSGHFYSFGPIPEDEADAVAQHVSPLPYHLYDFRLRKCGFEVLELATDKRQRSSIGWLVLWPLLAARNLLARRPHKAGANNALTLLLGRHLIVAARKRPGVFK